ncbi:MAG: hypothetical protein AAFQ22_13025 [Pseudomonadota bacterium]
MTTRDTDSLIWSLDYAARRLAGAFDLAFPGGASGSHMLRGAWAAACREVRYLDMMVRRLLVFMAGRITVETLSARQRPLCASPPPESGTPPTYPPAPAFALNERLPSLAQIQAMATGTPLGLTAPRPSALGEPAPVVSAARLAARFAALTRVLENHERYARLYARRLWRKGGRLGTVALKLVHGIRPGLARGGTLDLAASAYMEAERLCFCVLSRAPQ